MSASHDRHLAADPRTRPQDLRLLAYRPHLQPLIARNPSLAPQELFYLAMLYPHQVLKNPALRAYGATGWPWEVSDHFQDRAALEGAGYLVALPGSPRALHRSVHAHLLDAFPHKPRPLIKRAQPEMDELALRMLINPDLDPEVVRELRDHPPDDPFVARCADRHVSLWGSRAALPPLPTFASAIRAAENSEDPVSFRTIEVARRDLELYARLGWVTPPTLLAARSLLPISVAHALSLHPDTPEEERERYRVDGQRFGPWRSRYENVPDERLLESFHRDLPPSTPALAVLLPDYHPGLPRTLLEHLLLLPSPDLRAVLAQNPRLPLWAVRRLARDGDVVVRRAARIALPQRVPTSKPPAWRRAWRRITHPGRAA